MRVLVVYGSSRGGTAELATFIAESLVSRGIETDLGNAAEVDDLSGYDTFVVGGALYDDRWHPDATGFVIRHLPLLRSRSVWFFSTGPLDKSADAGTLAPVPQVAALAERTDVRGHVTFGGCLLHRATGLRWPRGEWSRVGDFRDPHQVDEWVTRIIASPSKPRHAITVLDLREPLNLTSDDLGLDVLMQ